VVINKEGKCLGYIKIVSTGDNATFSEDVKENLMKI